jgi:imidazolonepropionase-like amidohydrolase
MSVDNFYGTIKAAKSSDLIILEDNPLLDINAIDHINMVLSNGKLYSKNDLNILLRSIKH